MKPPPTKVCVVPVSDMVDVPALTVKFVGPLIFHATVVPPLMFTLLLPKLSTRVLVGEVEAKLTALTVWLLVVSVPWVSVIALQVRASAKVTVLAGAVTPNAAS